MNKVNIDFLKAKDNLLRQAFGKYLKTIEPRRSYSTKVVHLKLKANISSQFSTANLMKLFPNNMKILI